jgi:hypothetical protein
VTESISVVKWGLLRKGSGKDGSKGLPKEIGKFHGIIEMFIISIVVMYIQYIMYVCVYIYVYIHILFSKNMIQGVRYPNLLSTN